MKLSEFLAWWDAFVKANCEGIQADIRVPNGFRDSLVFRFLKECKASKKIRVQFGAKELTEDGESKILRVQFCATQEMIDLPGGLDELSSWLKGSIKKLKAEEGK